MTRKNIASGEDTSSSAVWGTLYGVVSALGYTAANVCLRASADLDPIWVSCVKAIPTLAVTAPWLIVLARRGDRVFPSRKILGLLGVGAVVGHVGGNVVFQWCLGVIGLAMTVPLCMGGILIFSVILARIFLREPAGLRTLASTGVLVAAVWVLSLGAGTASEQITSQDLSSFRVVVAVAAGCLSGFSYAVLGVMIRYAVQDKSSVAATTFSVSSVGFVCLAGLSWWSAGPHVVIETTAVEWLVMSSAGIANLVAFLALTRALQLATLSHVNGVNASQVAMCSICGVALFGEPLSAALGLGVVLTASGLMLMPRPRGSSEKSPSEGHASPAVDGIPYLQADADGAVSAPAPTAVNRK